MSGARHWEQDKEATVYIGNLDERVEDGLIWELMLQAGRIVNVHLPKDRVTQSHQGYGFVEFISEEDAEYAARVMNQVRLYGKPIRVNKASADKQKSVEVGAELFIGNLDQMVTEQMLYDTFGRFGGLLGPPKVSRTENGLSKGYGFVSFSNFEASDDAINNMHGQYLMNKEIAVQYAYKKDGKGERHGDEAERLLAAQATKHGIQPTAQALPPGFFPESISSGPSDLAHAHPGVHDSGIFAQQGPGYKNTGVYGQNLANHPVSLIPLQPTLQNPGLPPPGLPARPPPPRSVYSASAPMFHPTQAYKAPPPQQYHALSHGPQPQFPPSLTGQAPNFAT